MEAIDFDRLFTTLNNRGFKFSGGPSSSGNTIGDVIKSALDYIFPAAGILVLIYLLLAGLELMTSGGDPKKIQSAQGKITNAIIGFVIIFAAFWIVQLLSSFLGVPGLREAF